VREAFPDPGASTNCSEPKSQKSQENQKERGVRWAGASMGPTIRIDPAHRDLS